MKPTTEQDLSLKAKVIAIGAMALFGISIVVGAGGYTVYQREAKAEAVKTAAVQLANVEALKTTFPVFIQTAKGKEIADMAIVKVSQSELPKTITVPLTSTGVILAPPGIQLNRSGSGANLTEPDGGDNGAGWTCDYNGNVDAPSGADYGSYILIVAREEGADVVRYTGEFKITPPCPTGVTLSATSS